MANYNILQHNDLTKRGGERLNVFKEKIKNGDKFITTVGEVILDKKQAFTLDAMDVKGFSGVFTGKLNGSKVVLQYPKHFYKTPEFGGKGSGSGTAAEDRYLSEFRKNIQDELIKAKKNYILVKMNGRTIHVSDIISTPQTTRRAPKADFSLLDENGKQVGWISHKAGSKPTDFQQYGGLSDDAFSNNTEVKKFMTDLIKLYPKGLPSGVSVMRKAKNKDVILKSVFGTEYGKQPSIQNVDEFHQGSMKLVKNGLSYTITSTHKGVNGDIPKGGGYDCIYFARYTSDRGANVAGKFIGNARVGVFPLGKAVKTTIEI